MVASAQPASAVLSSSPAACRCGCCCSAAASAQPRLNSSLSQASRLGQRLKEWLSSRRCSANVCVNAASVTLSSASAHLRRGGRSAGQDSAGAAAGAPDGAVAAFGALARVSRPPAPPLRARSGQHPARRCAATPLPAPELRRQAVGLVQQAQEAVGGQEPAAVALQVLAAVPVGSYKVLGLVQTVWLSGGRRAARPLHRGAQEPCSRPVAALRRRGRVPESWGQAGKRPRPARLLLCCLLRPGWRAAARAGARHRPNRGAISSRRRHHDCASPSCHIALAETVRAHRHRQLPGCNPAQRRPQPRGAPSHGSRGGNCSHRAGAASRAPGGGHCGGAGAPRMAAAPPAGGRHAPRNLAARARRSTTPPCRPPTVPSRA